MRWGYPDFVLQSLTFMPTLRTMPSYSELRCSDSDRERVVTFLREQHSVGRLDHDELDERVGGAYAAKTIGQLERLMADLPRPGYPHRQARPTQSVAHRRPARPPALAPIGIAALVLFGGPMVIGLAIGALVLAIALVFAAGMFLTPFILVALLVIGLLRRRRPMQHHHGFRPHY
jgi:hypothetical protein